MLFNVILITVTLIACAFILEASARFIVLSFQMLNYEAARSIVPTGHSKFASLPTIPIIPYELKASTEGLFKLKTFSVNRHGLRDKDYDMKKPKNTIRFAVVGDSYTMGSGVAIENIWHSRLESQLNNSEKKV